MRIQANQRAAQDCRELAGFCLHHLMEETHAPWWRGRNLLHTSGTKDQLWHEPVCIYTLLRSGFWAIIKNLPFKQNSQSPWPCVFATDLYAHQPGYDIVYTTLMQYTRRTGPSLRSSSRFRHLESYIMPIAAIEAHWCITAGRNRKFQGKEAVALGMSVQRIPQNRTSHAKICPRYPALTQLTNSVSQFLFMFLVLNVLPFPEIGPCNPDIVGLERCKKHNHITSSWCCYFMVMYVLFYQIHQHLHQHLPVWQSISSKLWVKKKHPKQNVVVGHKWYHSYQTQTLVVKHISPAFVHSFLCWWGTAKPHLCVVSLLYLLGIWWNFGSGAPFL